MEEAGSLRVPVLAKRSTGTLRNFQVMRVLLRNIDRRDRLAFQFAIVVRIISNVLDIIALAGVGTLALLFSYFSNPGASNQSKLPSFLSGIEISVEVALWVAVLVATLFVVKSLFSIVFNFRIGNQIVELEAKYSKKILHRLFQNSTLRKENESLSAVQNTALYSINALFSASLSAIVTITAESTLLFLIISVLTLVNPLAAMFLVAYLVCVVVVLNRIVSARIRKYAQDEDDYTIHTIQGLRNLYSIGREVQLSNTLESWINQISENRKTFTKSTVRIIHFAGMPRYVVEAALILGLFAFLALAVLFSDLNSQAVTLGVFLTGGLRLVASALPLQSALNVIKASTVRGERALQLLVESNRENNKNNHTLPEYLDRRTTKAVEVKNLTLRAPEGQLLLNNISFSIDWQTKFAIVGPSGAGKTTLAEVLMGLRKTTSGSVSFGVVENGKKPNLSPLVPPTISYVPQKPILIKGTLRQNVTLLPNNDIASDHEILEILKLCGLEKVYSRLGEDLSARIEPDAEPLSGGEIQKLGLARALLGKPSFLVLDEATSALDFESESSIVDLLDGVKAFAVVVLIAHRLSTIRNADQILYLQDGKVKGLGKFEDLVKEIPDFSNAVEKMRLD